MATFNKTRAPTSRKYVTEKGWIMSNLRQTRQYFWLHSSFFVLERHSKNLNFESFYTTKTSFDVDFQWELSINFQKKYSWGRYNYVDFFQVTSIFLVAASAFAFKKSFYLLKRLGGGCFQWDGCVHFQMIWSGTSVTEFQIYQRHPKIFGDTPPFLP